MSVIDLNQCFPIGKDGTQKPLPKQKRFLDLVLDPNAAKFISYVGGVGSGKSLILCIAMLSQGIKHGGEYVVARQFMPELRRTTMKQFADIVPPSLLIEHRVADAEIHVRSASGKPAIFYFVGLDEPGKLRSLNLSGFGIDEASQVSDEAFLLLQSRLRNTKGLRKGILVGNPAGHNWIYQYFVKKDLFKTEEAKAQFALIVAPSTENHHLPDGYIESMLESYSEDRIQREVMANFDSFSGQVYSEFRRDVHIIPPFDIPKGWTRCVGGDHGFVNPAAFVWGAVDGDGTIYIYKELYESGWIVEELCRGNKKLGRPGIIQLTGKDKIQGIWLDPSTRAKRGQVGGSDWDHYVENLPRQWALMKANRDVEAGIDRVKSYLKLNPRTKKPRLMIFNTCVNLIDELVQYRYEELPDASRGHKNEREEPKKYKDHLCDATRYLVMSRPEPEQPENEYRKSLKAETLEGSLMRELERHKNPMKGDPFQDF